jgi:hypothetical protein
MKYVLKVKNENEIVSKVLNDYPFLNKDYAEKIVHMVIESIDFSFEQQSINVLQYITEDNLKAFSKIMQDTLFDRISRNVNIDYQDLLTTYRYRSSYIEYGGAKYKDIVNNPQYETRDHILLSKFFISGIYSNDAWHKNRDDSRIFILRARGANVSALLDSDLYTNDILMLHIYDTLLKGMPQYTITQQDMEKINQYLYGLMHPTVSGG